MATCQTRVVTSDPVVQAVRAYRRAEAAVDRRRAELADAIGEAILVHERKQSEIVQITGYTREHVRRICLDYDARVTWQALSSRGQDRPPSIQDP